MHIYIYIYIYIYVLRSCGSPDTGLIAVHPRPPTPRGRCGRPYHATTQFFCYSVMSKEQHSMNIYPWFWRGLTCPSQVFRNSYLIMWRHRGIALLRPGGGTWHNGLQRQLPTSTAEQTLLTTWVNCGNRVIRKISHTGSRASYGPYHCL